MRGRIKFGFMLLTLALFLAVGLSAAQAAGGNVSGTVWVEKTVDGEWIGESGFSGARLTLEERRADGTLAAAGNAVTNNNGEFIFSSVPDGEYRLKVEVTSDYRFTLFGLDSDALPAQGSVSYSPYFSVQNGRSVEKNFGITKNYATISVVAFEDSNANGGRMTSEPLLRNVRVEVVYEYEGDWLVIATATTDKDGEALIRELSPATYQLRVALPGNYVFGPLGQKMNLFYNCIQSVGDNLGMSEPFMAETRETMGLGIGAVKGGSVSGMVWNDANCNGVMDAGEGGLAGAAVTLYAPSTDAYWVVHTEADGTYAISNVLPGNNIVMFSLPDGMVFTVPGASLISEVSSFGSVDVLVQADMNTNLGNVGATPAASLTLSLYRDDNLNGVRDEGEAPVSGAAVTVHQNGAEVGTVVTGADGNAAFATLRGGQASVSVTVPDGYILSPDQKALFYVTGAEIHSQAAVHLDGGETLLSAAVTLPASISGMLFDDPGNTGFYQDGDGLLSGFTVQAIDENGDVFRETATDGQGRYTLSPLMPGAYTVRFLLDDAYVASPYGGNQTFYAIVNRIVSQTPAYGETESLELTPGQAVDGVNGGVFKAGIVDGDVLLGETETGLSGVTVTLLDSTGLTYSAYTYGVTDQTGSFFIKGVLPGTYTLLYTLPDGTAFTEPMIDEPSFESAAFTSESGSQIHMPTLRGIYTASLGGTILHDEVELDEPFAATIRLTGASSGVMYEYYVQEDGEYLFTGLRPDEYTLQVSLPDSLVFGQYEGSPITPVPSSQASAQITLNMGDQYLNLDMLAGMPLIFSGTVFYDEDRSAIQEDEEFGAEGRTIALWAGGELIAQTETDENGAFTFDHLLPGHYELRLPLDDYEVIVEDWDNLWTAGGEAWTAKVSFGEDTALYIPVLRYASVFGQVWSLDGSLNGVSGIPVTLLDADGNTVGAKITGENGEYAFEGCLLPGEYSLAADLPAGYLFAGSLDTALRESMIQTQADGTAQSIPFTVAFGDELSGVDIGIGALGTIGDRAWLDVNGNGMQDLEEPNMPGIVIELYRNGDLVASTTTDLYGRYKFVDLYPGEYEMRVTMHPEIKSTVRQTQFPLVASIMPESDETTLVFTGVVVPSGTENLHCDLGFQLREAGVYPAIMDQVPAKDWRPYSER